VLQLILSLIVVLVVVGVLLWLVNRYLAAYMAPPILNILNVAVAVVTTVAVLFWLLSAFGLIGLTTGPPVPKLR
jgi:hypothetical protein